jgi:hypothetical protein
VLFSAPPAKRLWTFSQQGGFGGRWLWRLRCHRLIACETTHFLNLGL